MKINRYLNIIFERQTDTTDQIIRSAMLERVEGDAPLVGENRVAGRVDENGSIPKGLAHVEGPHRNLECDVVNEHGAFCCTICLTTNTWHTHRIISHVQVEKNTSLGTS